MLLTPILIALRLLLIDSAQLRFWREELLPLTVPGEAGWPYAPVEWNTYDEPESSSPYSRIPLSERRFVFHVRRASPFNYRADARAPLDQRPESAHHCELGHGFGFCQNSPRWARRPQRLGVSLLHRPAHHAPRGTLRGLARISFTVRI